MLHYLEDEDDDEPTSAASPENASQMKPCDCGSPNCNSAACINPSAQANNQNVEVDRKVETITEVDSIFNLQKTLVRDLEGETSKDKEELDEEEVEIERAEEEEASFDYVPVKDSLPTSPEREFNANRDNWNPGCLCSYRDSKDLLLHKYIEHFNETIHYSKHLQKLNAFDRCTSSRCRANKGTSVHPYCCQEIRRNEESIKKAPPRRIPAICRRIDKRPVEFLDRNMERFCKMSKNVVPKIDAECIIIKCPISDDDEEDMEICPLCRNKVPKHQNNQTRYSRCHRNQYEDKSDQMDSLPETPETPRTLDSESSKESSDRAKSTERPICKKSIKHQQKKKRLSGGSQVMFLKDDSYKNLGRNGSKKKISPRGKIAHRKKTPYIPEPTDVATVSTQVCTKMPENAKNQTIQDYQDCINCSLDSEQADDEDDFGDNQRCKEKRTCFSGRKASRSSSQSSEKKHRRVISIRICGRHCGCSSPTGTKRVKAVKRSKLSSPTCTKMLNDRSKQLALLSCKQKPCMGDKASGSKLCLRKLMQNLSQKSKTEELQDQAKLVKSSQCQSSKCFQKEFLGSHKRTCFQNLHKGCVCKCDPSKEASVDQFTCTCSKNNNTSKEVSCQPLLSDNSTGTNMFNYRDCHVPRQEQQDFCGCTGLDVPHSFMNYDPPAGSNGGCKYNCEIKEDSSCSCTGRNFAHGYCNNSCNEPCTFGSEKDSYIYNKGTSSCAQWSHCHQMSKHYPHEHRPRPKLRYCMKKNLQTSYQVFYPTTAVQVDSMELIESDDRSSRFSETLKLLEENIIEVVEPKVPYDRRKRVPPIKDASPKPVKKTIGKQNEDLPQSVEESKDQSGTEILPSELPSSNTSMEKIEIRKVVGSVSALKEPSRGSEASGAARARESKRVSMKYDFALYDGAEGSNVPNQPTKPSMTDSIEERIRILRQNLEQRHDFGSESTSTHNSNRSQATLQSFRARGMSIQDEMDLSSQMAQQRNRFVSSGRLMKKGNLQ